jgi:peptidoglycan/xylan/chitin deacetylase (PgdA/CDA1 family)
LRQIIVTTSWDDGDPCDLRIAAMLVRHKMKGTFFVPVRFKRLVMNRAQLACLEAMGMEIGSHGMTHCSLTESGDALAEIRDSKAYLEDTLGSEVISFAYPKGRFNRNLTHLVRSNGYALGRTTVDFSVGLEFNPYAMPATIHFCPRPASAYWRHGIRYLNFSGLGRWLVAGRADTRPAFLARHLFDRVLSGGGLFHLWGHSWEVESLGLWQILDETLAYLSRRTEVEYLTNSEALRRVSG